MELGMGRLFEGCRHVAADQGMRQWCCSSGGGGCGALEDGREGLGQTLKRLHVYRVKGSSCYADGPSALELC